VQQPASQGKVQLIEKIEPAFWAACGPVMMPIRCDTPWTQIRTASHVHGYSPTKPDEIEGSCSGFLICKGAVLGEFPGKIGNIRSGGNFQRAIARWSSDLATPGAHQLTGMFMGKTATN